MTRYTATIRHHSMARAAVIPVGDTLTAAKAAATKAFGSGFRDHEIVIFDRDAHNFDCEIAARRRIGARKWTDTP